MDKEQELIDQIKKLLDNGDNSYDEIINLTTQLTSTDDNNIRFTVDAGLINRLGIELVAKQVTAVTELIKNAYDADATIVELLFKDTDAEGGKLLIRDNGLGMTKDQLIKGFMRIATADKWDNPFSLRYSRKRAGRKGIGRFSAQRLGTALTVITQTKETDTALQVTIDWNKFTGGKTINEISNEIKEIPKKKEEGTDLIIHDLRGSWTDAAIKRVFRYVFDLQQPFPLSAKQERIDVGFKTKILKQIGDIPPSTIADQEQMIDNYALAIISGYVDIQGNAYFSVDSDKLEIKEYDNILNQKYKSLSDVYFRAKYFIYSNEFMPRMMLNSIKDLAKEIGGMRVYRNGFRVMPYGQPPNDWLGLDKRDPKYPMGNANIFGFVEISDTGNNTFEEVTSREGLIENNAFNELRDFVSVGLMSGAARINSYRKPKENEQSLKNTILEDDNSTQKIVKTIKNITENLDVKTEKEKDFLEEQANELIESFNELKESHNKSLKQINMLRVLAALGLAIGEFTHEIRQPLEGLNANIEILNQTLSDAKGRNALERIKKLVETLKHYTFYFDKSVSQNVSRELKIIDLRIVVNEFLKTIENDLLRTKIEILPDIKGIDLHTCPMHPSEWSSILYNLYSNSKKAIIRAATNGKIKINVIRQKDELIIIDFSDNGEGIPTENKNKIFDEFFTTYQPIGYNNTPENDLVGSGLGLKIVRDIIIGYNGKIFVSEPEQDYKTCIRIEIPQATKQEIKDYGIN